MAKRRKRKTGWLARLLVFGFVAYVAILLIGMQLEVTAKRRQLETLQDSIVRQQAANDEARRMLSGQTDRETVERIARGQLDYAYPDERIFVDRSGN